MALETKAREAGTAPASTSGSDDGRAALVRSAGQLFAAYVEYMKLMLGNLFLLNAGSATALIAYFGAFKPDPNAVLLITAPALKAAIGFYAFGAVLAIAATLCMAIVENINSGMIEGAVLNGGTRKYRVWGGVCAGIFIFLSAVAFLSACMHAAGVWAWI